MNPRGYIKKKKWFKEPLFFYLLIHFFLFTDPLYIYIAFNR